MHGFEFSKFHGLIRIINFSSNINAMNAPLLKTLPDNEVQRLKAIRRYDVLDTPPDGAFERITAMVARRFQVPIAIISIVDKDRIWFKSHYGLDMPEIPREMGLCASAILNDTPYVVNDAKYDPRSLANPLVAGELGLRFYAAVPLHTSDGYNLGTLCALDKTPKQVDPSLIADLQDLASLVVDQLELRLSARLAAAHSAVMVREIDHRVMNSLQFVSNTLTLQSLRANTEPTQQLQRAADRVLAVARVHRHFYTSNGDTISCLNYLRRLCTDLGDILHSRIQVSGNDTQVPTTWIQPLGLIVNELVTNAAKYAGGDVRVSYDVRDQENTLTISDQGPGMPPGFDLKASKSLGMLVVQTLARQLGGTLEIGYGDNGLGTRFTVRFNA
jgi:two-component sensor histidine kinase